MSRHQLIISPEASDDLRSINHYSHDTWGQSTAEQYMEDLLDQVWLLTENPELGRVRDDLLPGIRGLSIARHIIFYRLKNDKVEIVRILHGRQDVVRHIG